MDVIHVDLAHRAVLEPEVIRGECTSFGVLRLALKNDPATRRIDSHAADAIQFEHVRQVQRPLRDVRFSRAACDNTAQQHEQRNQPHGHVTHEHVSVAHAALGPTDDPNEQ